MMRIPLTLLKPAVCLLLGASAIFTTTAASALTTYSLTFSSDTIGNTLSGSFDIDDSDPAAQQIYFSFNSFEPWLTNLSLAETISGVSTTYGQSDFSGFVWSPSQQVDFTLDLVPQFSDINFFAASPSAPVGNSNYVLRSQDPLANNTLYTLTSASPSASGVPAPLPILGLPAVLFYSRKLKKRIKASTKVSSNALA